MLKLDMKTAEAIESAIERNHNTLRKGYRTVIKHAAELTSGVFVVVYDAHHAKSESRRHVCQVVVDYATMEVSQPWTMQGSCDTTFPVMTVSL